MSKKKKDSLDKRTRRAEAELAELEAIIRAMELDEQVREEQDRLERDWEHGVFRVYGELDSPLCVDLEAKISLWSRGHEGKPITLYLYSPGGDAMAGWLLYDSLHKLRKVGHHISIVVRGYAASMGAVLLQAADTRLMGKESWIMVHEPSSGAWGKQSELNDHAKFIKKVNDRMYAVLAKRSKLSAKEMRALSKRKDVWLDSAEALELGLVDAIG